MKTKHARLRDDQVEALQIVKDKKGVPANETIRRALDAYLSQFSGSRDRAAILRWTGDSWQAPEATS